MKTTAPRDVVCNGCGGKGGRHTELACPFFIDRALSTRKERRERRRTA